MTLKSLSMYWRRHETSTAGHEIFPPLPVTENAQQARTRGAISDLPSREAFQRQPHPPMIAALRPNGRALQFVGKTTCARLATTAQDGRSPTEQPNERWTVITYRNPIDSRSAHSISSLHVLEAYQPPQPLNLPSSTICKAMLFADSMGLCDFVLAFSGNSCA